MIILKHLTIERFRLLRAMDLHFPQRGSILIQGPNESGKSALLESIYFALYGEAISSERGKRSLDDLVLYGAPTSTVTLTLSIGTTELTIARTIERGKGQRVILHVRKLGMPDEEPITQLDVANERIIIELGRMDGEALRNSCLIGQKGLNHLETLRGVEREATVRKLLGLERLTQLTEHFKVTPDDEHLLEECSERLRLAEIQARIPVLSEQLDDIEAALDAVNVCEHLEEIGEQEAEIAQLEQTLEQIKEKRRELKSKQARVQQLKRADATLAEIIAAYDDIAESRRELPELEKEIAELERLEREELPRLEKRVSDLAELTRSFGTLQRMSNDLLTAVDTIKELDHELKQHNEVQDDLKSLDEQVSHARSRLEQAQQALKDLEERRRAGRPQLEARLQRLGTLADRLAALRQVEAQYTRRVESRGRIEERQARLRKVERELDETEQELELVEAEATQAQQQANVLEKNWRQFNVRRQVEEWHRLKGLSLGLAQAEQHLMTARQHQERLTHTKLEARSASTRYMVILAVCGVGFLVCLSVALFMLSQIPFLSIIAVLALFALIGVGIVNFLNYRKVHEEEKSVHKLEQEAISRVGMMVAAREAAMRSAGNLDSLMQIENEIRTLGGSVPRSLEEAQQFLDQTKSLGDSIGDLQQRMKKKLDDANAARNQVNVTMEAVAALRKELNQLEEQRRKEDWDNIEENLRADQAAVERMQQEITLLAGQEGLPLASINARLQASPIENLGFSSGPLFALDAEEDVAGVPDLETLVESTVKATERELASLDGKLDLVTDLAAQAKIHQEALDVLLARQRAIADRNARYQTSNPALQIERAREQQAAVRSALHSLQDSLRQRVRPLGVAFGQTAISNAETVARNQLEELQINLGNKIMLQEKHSNYGNLLKERQESLAELYKQLAKFSNTLGSWIVPLNPFAEALVALRNRCQREIEEGNEPGILKEFEMLQNQEAASNAKIELCGQDIADAQAYIASVLSQRSRPKPKTYTRPDLVAVWPLLAEYSAENRSQLEEERGNIERELDRLEKNELELSQQLGTGNEPLDLEQTRARMEQQERSYQTKKHGYLLVKAVNERLMHKMIPRTEHHMQQILPLLTSGRYHDVHLVTEDEEGTSSGGPFQLSVWDSAAGEYVPKSALSGGAADQLSLALRLAFAIATLPRDLNAAPGFVLLDEPLSSFDRGRAQALVDVVTGEVLSQHFEQIILISHNSVFDPALFPYHVYMENGLIVESNLPVVPNLPPINLNNMNGKSENTVQVVEPVKVAAE